MKLPLCVKIKKKVHQEIAAAQDIIVEEMYNFFPQAVFHGGTAIWRCYQGNRFSEDIDVYLQKKESEAADNFFQALERKGFEVIKKRVKENSIYSVLSYNKQQVRFEAVFEEKQNTVLQEYEMIDGNLFTVFTLSANNLVAEKMAALLKRKKVRDLYDIYFLLRYADKISEEYIKKILAVDLVDEKVLPALILTGPVPTITQMKEYIARQGKSNLIGE
jgi:predicted nucleotidyltransferase component of viral defense system